MKKRLFAASFFVFLVTFFVHSQAPLNLDVAIKAAAEQISLKMEKNTVVLVFNISSPTKQFSDYVADELLEALVSMGNLIVVDRQNLAALQEEMNFQMSGEVSDDSAQAVGKKLGAQFIVSGSVDNSGVNLRLRIRVTDVVTAAIPIPLSYDVKKDAKTATLLSGPGATSVSGTGYPNGLNFSTGRKVGAGFLNGFFGLGSFTMGDWLGGFLVGASMLGGTILVGTSSNPTDEYGNTTGETSTLSTAGTIGTCVMVAGMIYGHVRPFTYDKSLAKKRGTYYTSPNPVDHIDIALIPSHNGIKALQMTYSVQF